MNKNMMILVVMSVMLFICTTYATAQDSNAGQSSANGLKKVEKGSYDECSKYTNSISQSLCIIKPSITKGAAAAVAISLVFVGWYIIKHIRTIGALEPYLLQVLGITLVLPVLLILSIQLGFAQDAVIGILGTIVGYVFGSIQQQKSQNNKKDHDTGAT